MTIANKVLTYGLTIALGISVACEKEDQQNRQQVQLQRNKQYELILQSKYLNLLSQSKGTEYEDNYWLNGNYVPFDTLKKKFESEQTPYAKFANFTEYLMYLYNEKEKE